MEERGGIERVDGAPDGSAEVEVFARRRTVVSALPLKRVARERLARLLDARVLDIRDDCPDADLVLAPSSSPQLVGMLRRQYPSARIVVVELDDEDLDVELGGPVKRLLRSGVDAYLLADSLEELAAKLRPSAAVATPDPDGAQEAAVHELSEGATADDVVAAFLREAEAAAERIRRSDRG